MSSARKFAALSKSLESVSSKLSIAAVLGLTLLPLLHPQAASTLGAVVVPQPAPHAKQEAPIELVRAKPVPALPAPEAAAAPAPPIAVPPADVSEPASEAIQLAARRSERRNRQRPVSDGEGKFGAQKQALADKAPIPAETKAEPPPPEPPKTTWSEGEIITGLRECLKLLAPIAAEIEIAEPVRHDDCGTPAPVMLKRLGSGATRVDIQPPAMINCAMVARLHSWVEKTLQPAAQETLGQPIVRLRNASGYVCRNRNGSRNHADKLSEHAFANALDVSAFVTADGRSIEVARHWGPTERDIREQQRIAAELKAKQAKEAKDAKDAKGGKDAKAAPAPPDKKGAGPKTSGKERDGRGDREADRQKGKDKAPIQTAELQKLGKGSARDAKAVPATVSNEPKMSSEAAFLRRLHKGACGTFGTVLGPEANEAHRDHFHFDLASRRRNAFCE